MHYSEQMAIADISKILTISYSSVYRICYEYERDLIRFSNMFSSEVFDLNSGSEKNLIKYINNNSTLLTTTDIKHLQVISLKLGFL